MTLLVNVNEMLQEIRFRHCVALVETLMQWMSASPTAREIDREIGDLRADLVAAAPLLSYLRSNVMLSWKEVEELCPGLSTREIASLGEMDSPDNLDLLVDLGEAPRSVTSGTAISGRPSICRPRVQR